MKIRTIEAGDFMLDGGAMFGVVPQTIWSRTNPADDKNRIPLKARSLLIENGARKILVDTGLGNKQSAKFFGYYDWSDETKLTDELRKAGIEPENITDVFLTHLHFDHCGGTTYLDENSKTKLTFPNAAIWTNRKHWEWAIEPNAREKASFLKENLLPMQESGKLRFVEDGHDLPFEWITVNGHTEEQMLPLITLKKQKLLFMADLLPTVHHVPLPYVMSYDMRPLETLKERQKWFVKAAEEGWHLILEHDFEHECCNLTIDEKGVKLHQTYSLSDINL
ncbi:MAG: MBL fold metallo-hydrolase [Cytophagales bacterium]|nr:MBL fold metallo-hydrolase [Cytophagales bacterium]